MGCWRYVHIATEKFRIESHNGSANPYNYKDLSELGTIVSHAVSRRRALQDGGHKGAQHQGAPEIPCNRE